MTYPTKTHRAAHGYQITRLEPYDLPVEQLLSMLTTARQLKLAVSRRPDGSGVGALVVRAEYFPERVSVGGLHFVTMPIPGEDEGHRRQTSDSLIPQPRLWPARTNSLA